MASTRNRDELAWYRPAAELMAKEGISLKEAAAKLRVELSSSDAEKVQRTKTFQSILRTERLRFYNEIAAHPEYRKQAVVGMMLYNIERLTEGGEAKEALDGLNKLSKVEGWQGQDTVNVFTNLSAKDFQQLRHNLTSKQELPDGPTEVN